MNINRYIRTKFRISGQDILPLIAHGKRDDLAGLFCELGYKVGVEIGVCEGVNSEILLQKNPGLKLFCIDPWMPYGSNIVTQEAMDELFKVTQDKLSHYDVQYIRKTSMDAIQDILDNSLDFVYIDAMHDFDNVMCDVIEWSKKVRSGGIVSGHDYSHGVLDRKGHSCGVIPAVKAYTMGHGIVQWFITNDKCPSWFWVKS